MTETPTVSPKETNMDQQVPPYPLAPPGLPPGPGYYAPPPPSSQANGFAIASLVLGVMSLLCMNCMTAVPGVIFGHVALWQMGRPGASQADKGLAVAGLVTGYLGLLLTLVFVVVYVLFIVGMAAAGNLH